MPHIYVNALMLCYFHSLTSTQTISGQMQGGKECPFSGVHNQLQQSLEERCQKTRLGV